MDCPRTRSRFHAKIGALGCIRRICHGWMPSVTVRWPIKKPSLSWNFEYCETARRWIESRVLISYNEAGRAVRRIGAQVDVTERKRAEGVLVDRNAQLALAGQAAQVGVYTYDVNKGAMLISEGYAAIHGLPGGTTETSYSEWRARVHPEDLDRAEALRDQAFARRTKLSTESSSQQARSDGSRDAVLFRMEM